MLLFLLLACHGSTGVQDADGDGVSLGDCDDTDPRVHPGAAETCDYVDQDCDNEVDEGVTGTFGLDADGDGYGDPAVPNVGCAPPEGFVADTSDCDDADAAVHPGATEVCNGEDDDCDGTADTSGVWYSDADGDGYGDPATEVATCLPEAGQVAEGGDCDDADAGVHPGAEEGCDADDDDCDGRPDEGVEGTWYADADGDGYGDPATSEVTCAPALGWVADATDCLDTDGAAHPGASERCNDADDDCDAEVDEGMDADADGHRTTLCADGDDCDDGDASVYAGADDACEDGLDEDCDGADPTCGFPAENALGLAETKLYAPEPNYDAGRLIELGDTDGDGLPELIVATYYAAGFNGGMYVVDPRVSGTQPLDAVGYALTGDAAAGGAGRSIGVGDVDGDGLDDVGMGVPFDYSGNGYAIFYGPITADSTSGAADVTLVGVGSTYAGHGGDLADVDGDGIADALVGAYGEDTVGAVRVKLGPISGQIDLAADADAVLLGEEASSYAGRVVRGGGDLDGDGIGDIVTGGPASINGSLSGAVYVVYGPPADVDLSAADGRYLGEGASNYAGNVLAMGDVNGDGLDDLGIGAYDSTGGAHTGTAWVVYGPANASDVLTVADIHIDGDAAGQYAGTGLSMVDIDGDGVAELLVGGKGDATYGVNAGAAWLFLDPVSGTFDVADADAAFRGEGAGDAAGTGVLLGDVDGDGLGEVLVGAPAEPTGGAAAGAVYVAYGVR